MTIAKILEKDATLSQRLRVAEQPGALRNFSAFLAHSGDSWVWLAALPFVWWFGNDNWKYRAIILFVAIFITATIVMALKFTIRRQRPEGDWGQIYRKTDPHSFPSGHAARGMLIGVLAWGLGPAWFGWVLIIWGPLVGLARIAMGVHYVSDVLAGWVVGAVMGIISYMFLPQMLSVFNF
ncbi:MAG: phosphatase PAP2 family protein [Chloroflexota bacterium]